ncbi:type I-U CRISPR-associated RAMP protein Csb1/Cas7u [Tepidiforma sp.]|uniref:type I-G CRISPR-associated RAMP protein Csb1/Cas7g n=1 Tax=Tepidiforma sp. TaxID=2682230 RepID=UPI002ADD7D99|nr:type I-U CRISPR-associated RAMP protein Csb1/Cas7u [Tepidiforma sp.]
MSEVEELYERLAAAVTLESDDAAIRIGASYQPQAGPDAKVFPPTYMERDGTRYHFEKRWSSAGSPLEVVILDSYQSQANRCEAALEREAAALGLPRLVLNHSVNGNAISISSLIAPHRSRDAYFLDALVDGRPFDETPVGMALDRATLDDLTPFLQYVPTDLVYGIWDSHRGKRMALKFARSYTSEMLGWEPQPGKRAATKGDPLNLPGNDSVDYRDWRPAGTSKKSKDSQKKLSELGHGMVPGEPDESIGGVAVRGITRLAVLSLTGLARLSFSSDEVNRAGRTMLAAVGLLGDRLAFGGAGLHLRSGCDLVLESEHIEWVQRGGRTEPLELDRERARELFHAARRRLERAGIAWSGEPVVLTPSKALAEVIAATLTARPRVGAPAQGDGQLAEVIAATLTARGVEDAGD